MSGGAPPGVARDRGPGRDAEGSAAEGMREQARADLTEAIAVLTPEQQAQAWEIVTGRPRRGPRPDAMPPGPRRGPGG